MFKAMTKAFGSRSNDLLTTGPPGRATIKSFTDTGGREGADPRVVVDLDAQVYLSKLQPGGSLAVRVDPSDPSALAIDWSRP